MNKISLSDLADELYAQFLRCPEMFSKTDGDIFCRLCQSTSSKICSKEIGLFNRKYYEDSNGLWIF